MGDRGSDRLAVLDQGGQHARGGRPIADGGEEARRGRHEGRVDVQQEEHARDVAGERPDEHAHAGTDRQPRLGEAQALLGLAASDRVRRRHLHGAHQPEDDAVAQEHDHRADPHPPERRRSEPADELRVDQAEQGLAEHGRGDRPREVEQLAYDGRLGVCCRSLAGQRAVARGHHRPLAVSDPTFVPRFFYRSPRHRFLLESPSGFARASRGSKERRLALANLLHGSDVRDVREDARVSALDGEEARHDGEQDDSARRGRQTVTRGSASGTRRRAPTRAWRRRRRGPRGACRS